MTGLAPLRFGANYTPSNEWMHSWLNLDLDTVRRDFSSIAELGLDHLRIFPLWPILQPNRSLIRGQALADVRAVVDVAHEFGLDVSVDVLQGHLSSFDFLPSWVTTWHEASIFADERVLGGVTDLVTALGGALAEAPNFLGLTLGNEINQFTGANHPSRMPATVEQTQHWINTLLTAAQQAAPKGAHVHSEDDQVWYRDGHPFVPAQASNLGAMTTVHSWIFNGTAQRYGGRALESDRHAEYLIELSRAFATDPNRQIWLQEVGAPSNVLETEEMPGFVEATVRSAARCDNLWGVTWWCSHDVSRSLVDFPELEYTLGLFDNDNGVKPVGRMFGELAAELRAARPAPAVRTAELSIRVDEQGVPLDRASLRAGGEVFDAWMSAAREGEGPSLVLEKA